MQVPMFSIITREATGTVRDIHGLMPLILWKDNLCDWIRPDGDSFSIIEKKLTNMIVEKANEYSEPLPDYIKISNM